MGLSKDIKIENIKAAKPFIESYIKYINNIYRPQQLYSDNTNDMTKKVVTHDLINRMIRELEDLLK